VFARGRSANTVAVHPPVLSSINIANTDYDTASSQTDSSDSILSDYQNLYDPPEHEIQPTSVAGKLNQKNM